MIFTVGHRPSYDRGLVDQSVHFMKLGKRAEFRGRPYAGGSVWRSLAEAEQYLADNQPRLSEYAAYGLLTDWENTEQLVGEPFRRLLVDAQIVAATRVGAT